MAELFLAVRGRDAPSRSSYLAEVCRDDRSLAVEVESLLAGEKDSADLLGSGSGDAGARMREMLLDRGAVAVPERLGQYRIAGVLGQGGMGVVYRAEQERPKRAVALKVVRPGLLSPSTMRRFEHESAALARLHHAGIAQVYEAGVLTGADGSAQPYFAMELVEGTALTEYAQRLGLGLRQRLELLVKVCAAVQHAHQRGIIHRDLKPGNILVEETGQPKILDFGVARLTDSDAVEGTLNTLGGAVLGTLAYMSPEQASGEADEVDTRSDVYSLGVIAYELLAGRLPLALAGKSLPEAVRAIGEEEPARLGTLDRDLRGDLETIVAKALEKDRSRRYASAAGLGADIERFLGHEPIAARPATAWYQARKFARRHRAPVVGIAATFLALAGGVITTGLALQRESQQTAIAEAEALRARKAEAAERSRADELKKVSDFQSQALAEVDPTEAGKLLTVEVKAKFDEALAKAGVSDAERAGLAQAFAAQWERVNATDVARDLIERTILRPGAGALERQFADQPVVDAALRQVLADRYYRLGLYDAAMPLQERALATRRAALGEEHPDTLVSISNMGTLLVAQGKLAEAEPYLREALEKFRREPGAERVSALGSISNMGALLQAQGKLAEAEPYLREAMDGSRRELGEEHPRTLSAINNLGLLLREQGKPGEAEPFSSEALEKSRRVLGEEHPDTVASIINLGLVLFSQGRLSEAEPYLREAMEKSRRVLGEEHPSTLTSFINLGSLLRRQGRLAEAEPYLREALEKSRRELGGEHPGTLAAINSLGVLLREQGKPSEAEPYSREALEKRRRVLGEEHPDTLTSINNMGRLLQALGRLGEAEVYSREAVEKFRRVLGEEHPNTLNSINNLGGLLLAQGRPAEAAQLLTPAEGAARNAFTGGNAGRLAAFLTTLGKARAGIGEYGAAETNLLEAQLIFATARGEAHKETRDCAQALVDLYTAWHAAEPGKGYEAKGAEWRAKVDGIK